MKKLILTMGVILASGLLFADGAYAAKKSYSRPYGMAGCGLGSMVIGDSGGQVFAATTNGTAWNQTFGITAGTSNCVDDGNSTVARKMDLFIESNKGSVASDIARGDGETLANISSMMGCEVGTDAMGAALQQNFRSIFPNTKVQSNHVTDSIISVVRDDARLSAGCKNVI